MVRGSSAVCARQCGATFARAGDLTNVAIAKGSLLMCLRLRRKFLLESFAIELLALDGDMASSDDS
jgi:hypothetical protein